MKYTPSLWTIILALLLVVTLLLLVGQAQFMPVWDEHWRAGSGAGKGDWLLGR